MPEVDEHDFVDYGLSSDSQGETSIFDPLVFSTPSIDGLPSIDIYSSCIAGSCACIHLIGDAKAQLKPRRAAQFLFGGSALPSISDQERIFLWSGLINGFAIVDEDCPSSYNCANYDSITGPGAYDEMSALLLEEIQSGKVTLVENQPQCVHSLGAVRKSNGKLRPITDCSRPDGLSINNYMETTFESFSYNSVDTAVTLLEQSDFMSVIDIASAYRSVSVHFDHVHFQGLSWDFGQGPVWLLDQRLCFGLRCAPNIFNSISSFIVKIVNHWGADRVVNYLDDFLVVARDEATCAYQQGLVTTTIQLLGFEVSWKKVTPPFTISTFLGITIDSSIMELSLPMEKVEKLKTFLTSLLDKGCASKKELERAGGLVSHCSYVVRGGRTFSRRIFDLAASYSRQCTSIPLDDNIKDDFNWWLAFCNTFNGRACILKNLYPVPMYTDSSFTGFGA